VGRTDASPGGLRPSLEAARNWYDETAGTVLEGLHPIDDALCAMLGWDTSRGVAFETLRQDFGWQLPTMDELTDHWL
jgi:hypothetical protein